MKTCIRCDKDKELDEFHKNKNRSFGRQDICKLCKKEYDKQWRKNNAAINYMYHRKSHLKTAYGLTYEAYSKMWQEQEARCKICGIGQENLKLTLSVDHDHKTGKVRGLLCRSCNGMLGLAKDNVEILNNAIKYLLEIENGK